MNRIMLYLSAVRCQENNRFQIKIHFLNDYPNKFSFSALDVEMLFEEND